MIKVGPSTIYSKKVMTRRKTKMVKINDPASLEKLLQETYTDACGLISETGTIIHELVVNGQPEDSDDLAKITKEKINALKVRDSAIRIKLDVSKLMNDVIKYNGENSPEGGVEAIENGFNQLDDALASVREMYNNESRGGEKNSL